MDEEIEVVFRSVVKGDGDELSLMVSRLTSLFGPGVEVDIFEESLVFKPLQDSGNMNVVNRDVIVTFEYRSSAASNTVVAKHIGSSIPVITETDADAFSAYNVRTSSASNANLRRTFLKSGFVVRNDFARKGLKFATRKDRVTILLSRPYNALFTEGVSYLEGSACWETLPGPLPFESDYLLEVKQCIKSQADVSSAVMFMTKLIAEFKKVT